MKKTWKELGKLGCLLPAAFVAICSVKSIGAYTAQEYKGKAIVQKRNAQNRSMSKEEEELTEAGTEAEATTSLQAKTEKEKQTANQTGTKKSIRRNVILPTIQTSETSTSTQKNLNQKKSNGTENIQEIHGYKDGTYYGQGTGFGGITKVKVVVKKNKIAQIIVLETKDDEAFFEKAKGLLTEMIDNQTTEVDIVSGATYSSNGLIEAVRDALKDAALEEKQTTKGKSNKSETTKKTKKDTKQNTTQETTTSVENQKNTGLTGFSYKDGVYFGTGEGYRGEITVAIVIENQKLQYALVTKSEDDEKYFTRAKDLLKTVVEKQSTQIDVVSGATFSSKGILEAIENAVKEAQKAAGIKVEEQESTATVPETTTKNQEQETSGGSSKYKDGSYQVEAICEPDGDQDFLAYQITAKVTITGGRITNIEEVTGFGTDYIDEDEWYISRALSGTKKAAGILSQAMNKGSEKGIDVVSGATCSSNSLIQIIKKAFEMANLEEK